MDRDELAARRYWVLQIFRLTGLALVLAGAMILSGRIGQPDVVGAALLIIGAIDFFAMPVLLARRWKSGE